MDMQKVDMYLIANQKYFPAEKTMLLKEKLLSADDNKLNLLSAVELNDPMVLLLISIFVGELGVDRFMLGDIGMGVLKLLTGGVCGVLWLVDIFTITGKVKELNYNKVMALLQ